MVKRTRALNKQEFEAATSDGAVYGKYLKVYAYIELGQEGRYQESSRDDQNTRYRLFKNCTAFYTTTLEQLKSGDFEYDTQEDVLIVYY